MRIHPITIYESIKFQRSVLLPHSRLYNLEPIGIGTELVESLTGYVERIAIAHCVTTSKLYIHEIMPLIIKTKHIQGKKPSISSGRLLSGDPFRKVTAINGMGIIAKDWTQAIESLTLISNLHYLTTITWRNVISDNSWLRQIRAWCPICYQEQKNSNKILYDQLLWTLRIVTVCIVHSCPLTMLCPHCYKNQAVINSMSRPGYCNKCQGWLGMHEHIHSNEVECDDEVANDQFRIANAMGKLLATAPKIIKVPERESVIKSINICLKYFTDGNKAAFGRRFGITQTVLIRWIKGFYLPRISTLLKVCLPAGIEPLNFLQGDITFTESDRNTRSNDTWFRNYEDEERKLKEILNEFPPLPLSTVAVKLNYTLRSDLYRLHSKLTKQISARYRLFISTQNQLSKMTPVKDSANAQYICEVALNETPPPSICEVAKRIGDTNGYGNGLKTLFPDLYKLLKSRRKEYTRSINIPLEKLHYALSEIPPPSINTLAKCFKLDVYKFESLYPEIRSELNECQALYKQQQLQKLRIILETALYEDPLPSILQLAKRAGYNSCYPIAEQFPELYREIVMRRKNIAEQKSEKMRRTLEGLLEEMPPLPFEAVCQNLGVSSSSLHKRYPDISHQIVTRYKKFVSEIMIKRRKKLYEETRKIILELHSQGITPTVKRVCNYSSSQSIRESKELRKIVRELKLELNLI